MALFDRYLIVDWSAKGELSPKAASGDALWLCEARRQGSEIVVDEPRYFRGRTELMVFLKDCLLNALQNKERVFAGFDFAFGYPQGTANALTGKDKWSDIWGLIDQSVEDGDDNSSNRFEVAAKWNSERFDGRGPFWGHPHGWDIADLPAKRPIQNLHGLPERRLVENEASSAQPVWKLAYTGSVGSQTLLGIARLQKLRTEPELKGHISIWPFETGFDENLTAPITIAEIYPSLFAVEPFLDEFKDAAQVRTLAEGFANLDAAGLFNNLISAPDHLVGNALNAVLQEEGWIVGAGSGVGELSSYAVNDNAPERSGVKVFDFEADPAAIYAQSFNTIAEEASLGRFDRIEKSIVTRMIHACGVVDIAKQVEISPRAVVSGLMALEAKAPIICDVRMVQHGIITRNLPEDTNLLCGLDRVGENVVLINTTRSASGIDAMRDELGGSIVVIGNAPTALFQLINRIEEGWAKPSLIIGCPVGFVGAMESKEALANHPHGVPFITLHGRMGGSAIASAALNALAIEAKKK